MRYGKLLLIAMILALLQFSPTDAAPKSNIELLWNKGVSPSGYYVLSTLVNRKAKTWGWTNEVWYSPPIFSEFEIVLRGSKYFFTGGNFHEEVIWLRIEGAKLEGNPCDPPGNNCITRIRVIDKDTFAILVNGEESTFCRVDGMMQIYPEENGP